MISSFKKNSLLRIKTGIPLLLILFLLYYYAPFWALTMLTTCIILWILLREWPLLINPKTTLFWIITPLYPTLPLIIILMLIHSSYRPLFIIIIILSFAHDSAAYLIGTLYGKHLLAPKISPKKTWEGALAGFVAVYLILLLYMIQQNLFSTYYEYFQVFLFALLISICATTGDLFESWFKRKANLKDSGHLLPGHGGLLDKIDGLLFIAPMVYFLLPSICSLLKFF